MKMIKLKRRNRIKINNNIKRNIKTIIASNEENGIVFFLFLRCGKFIAVAQNEKASMNERTDVGKKIHTAHRFTHLYDVKLHCTNCSSRWNLKSPAAPFILPYIHNRFSLFVVFIVVVEFLEEKKLLKRLFV